MQLENQVVQIQIQTNETFQIIWEAFLYSCSAFKGMNFVYARRFIPWHSQMKNCKIF